jgi:chloramphenicol-sensitive protein RarD
MSPRKRGILSALGAYGSWGLLPLYWKEVAAALPSEIMAHRAVWSFVLSAAALLLLGSSRLDLRRHSGTILRAYLLSSLLIGLNWLLYIWAVTSGHVLESSLGYFLNPLVNVIVGALLFRERLSFGQRLAVALAATGALYLVANARGYLWISFVLAISFCFYGVLRKKAALPSLDGMYLETLMILPLGVAYLVYLAAQGQLLFLHSGARLDLLLVGSGLVTLLPLLFFSDAAQRLPLSTLGMFQYISPTLQFLLAVFLYAEPFSTHHLIGFGFIWSGLAVYTLSSGRRSSG